MTGTANFARAFALARLAFGAGLIARPDVVGGGWIGPDASRPGTTVAVRAVGARDCALAAGVLAAAGDDSRLRPWLAATAAGDLADLAATLAAPAGALPDNARWGTAALAGGGALAGLALYAALGR